MARRGARWTTALVAGGLVLLGGMAAAAQEATPGAAAHAHPAHIHLGTCDTLDPNPTYMLSDVAPATGADSGEADAIPVERSATTVEDTLENLRTGGYAINIHQSVEDIGTYIACGSLSGAIDDAGALIVGLGELNGSGHTGIAILTANGDQTDVNVYLAQGLSGAAPSMSESQADDAAVTADAVMVDIRDLAYDPATIEISAGTTVTWMNSDTVPHTATAQDRDVLQSGTLDAGDTFSQTFDAPGTIDYFCEFHPNMKGTIIVQ